jgi:hypothetical protein
VSSMLSRMAKELELAIAQIMQGTGRDLIAVHSIRQACPDVDECDFERGLEELITDRRVEKSFYEGQEWIRLLPIFPDELVDQFFNHVVGIGLVHVDDKGQERLGLGAIPFLRMTEPAFTLCFEWI